MSVHTTAIVSEQAQVAHSATIGPYCVIDGDVVIGERTVVESHARIGSRYGSVSIGADNFIHSGAVLGGPAQDYTYREARTRLEIGDHNRIGEYSTINLGTVKGGGVTRVGDRNFIMSYVHLAHDCQIGNHVVLTNSVQLAGHVVVEDRALLAGITGVVQFTRLGSLSFLVGGSFANKDIPPYTIAEGHWATVRAVNSIGLRRAGFDASVREQIGTAVRILLDRSFTLAEVVARIEAECEPIPAVRHFAQFLRSSKRGVARA